MINLHSSMLEETRNDPKNTLNDVYDDVLEGISSKDTYTDVEFLTEFRDTAINDIRCYVDSYEPSYLLLANRLNETYKEDIESGKYDDFDTDSTSFILTSNEILNDYLDIRAKLYKNLDDFQNDTSPIDESYNKYVPQILIQKLTMEYLGASLNLLWGRGVVEDY